MQVGIFSVVGTSWSIPMNVRWPAGLAFAEFLRDLYASAGVRRGRNADFPRTASSSDFDGRNHNPNTLTSGASEGKKRCWI